MPPQSQLVSPNPLPTPSSFILVSCFSFALCLTRAAAGLSFSASLGGSRVLSRTGGVWPALLLSLAELCTEGGYGRAHTGDTTSTVRRRLSTGQGPWCRHASSAVAPACAVHRNVLLVRRPQVSAREVSPICVAPSSGWERLFLLGLLTPRGCASSLLPVWKVRDGLNIVAGAVVSLALLTPSLSL